MISSPLLHGRDPPREEHIAIYIRRREFIVALGSAVTAWPLIARAQPLISMRRIGVMMAFAEDDRGARQQADALRRGLQESGWTDNSNIRIDLHWDVHEGARAQLIAKDIVALQPDLIVSHAVTATSAVSRLTKTIPIVFVNVFDPVALGLVSSFARPGGNITGFTNFEPSMGGKWLEVLKDLDPRIRRVAMLFNPETAAAGGKLYLTPFKAAGAALGIETIEAPVHDLAGIEKAIDATARQPNGGLIAMADAFTYANREIISRLATNNHLPFLAAFRPFTEAGGLISYGIDQFDIFHRAASYVDRILKGTKPSDLPVQFPTKFEMVINLKTARALGLTVPPALLALADEVIE
jgi:putative ABC transport system substrate-binding protein